MRQPDLAPRCDRPVTPYETPGRPTSGKYGGYGPMIREAREKSGLSPAQLAAAVGVASAQTVIWWELEWSYPGRAAAALERMLGVWLPGPRCGRPAGHRGQCRSEAALVRYLEQAQQQRRAA